MITDPPVFYVQCWVDVMQQNGETARRRINSIAFDKDGTRNQNVCPFLKMITSDDPMDQPQKTWIWGCYNFNTRKVQMFRAYQVSILRGIGWLAGEIEKKPPVIRNGKQYKRILCDYVIMITKTVTGEGKKKKTEYKVSFAPDANEPWSPEEQEAVREALDPQNPNNINQLIANETRWPSQSYLLKIGLDVELPYQDQDEPAPQYRESLAETRDRIGGAQKHPTPINRQPPEPPPDDAVDPELTENDIPF
jgi:hypothetical protein